MFVWFQYFYGFQINSGSNCAYPTDFAGHCYNSAAATMQPV